jgi:hypothetical protein
MKMFLWIASAGIELFLDGSAIIVEKKSPPCADSNWPLPLPLLPVLSGD